MDEHRRNLEDKTGQVINPATEEKQDTIIVDTAAMKTSLEIMDDWDEANRAKVNPIVGQAGVASGTGVDGSTVQRVSLATDIALPTGTNTLGSIKITDDTETANVTANNELNVLPSDFQLEVGRGNVSGIMCVDKFGAAPSGIQTTATDVWSRADAAVTQQIWLAPTAARIHTISSDSAQDASGGTGVTSITVSYLADWDTAETTETVTGDFNAGVAMNNAAVIIHRMVCTAQSTSTAMNAGTILATAATDATITAVILPGNGQTEMAIYGIPSTQTLYLTRWSCQIDKATGATASCDFQIRVNTNPDVQTTNFIRKQDMSLQSTGTNALERHFACYPKIAGPAIIKIQGIASANDLDAESSFDGYVVDN